MNRHWTFAQYRRADLLTWAGIGALCEYVMTLAARRWFPAQLYTVSVTAAVCAIVLMRWGGWAGLHAAVGGLVFALASGGSRGQMAVYALGNLGCLALLPLLKKKQRIRSDKLFR